MRFLAFIYHIVCGMGSALSLPTAELYRYPYRNSGEAVRGDWLKIGKDIENTIEFDDE